MNFDSPYYPLFCINDKWIVTYLPSFPDSRRDRHHRQEHDAQGELIIHLYQPHYYNEHLVDVERTFDLENII